MITYRRAPRGIQTADAPNKHRSFLARVFCLVMTLAAALCLTVVAAGTASAGVTQFVINRGIERPATGVPVPPSGMEVSLTNTGSSGSTTVSGSGRVVVGATGKDCEGWPSAAVYVDGVNQGNLTFSSKTNYGAYLTPRALAAGSHAVKVVFLDDRYVAGVCDRNINLATVRMEFAPTTVLQRADATTTGVPDGTALTVHQGDITVTQAGTVIDRLDVHGSIYVKANNVTIKRSLIRGGPASSKNKALIASWWGNTNLVVQDSTLRADFPSYWMDGLTGSNFTATRLDISRVVDTVKVAAGNATITNSWLHDNAHFSPDPNQSDNKTHDDGIQVSGGKNIVISGNNIHGAHNASVMVGQGTVVADLKITGNWLSDGGCAVNVSQGGTGGPILGSSVQNNKFGPGVYGTTCPMRLPKTSPITVSGNTWAATSTAAVPNWF